MWSISLMAAFALLPLVARRHLANGLGIAADRRSLAGADRIWGRTPDEEARDYGHELGLGAPVLHQRCAWVAVAPTVTWPGAGWCSRSGAGARRTSAESRTQGTTLAVLGPVRDADD